MKLVNLRKWFVRISIAFGVLFILCQYMYSPIAIHKRLRSSARYLEKIEDDIGLHNYTVERVIDGDTLKLTNGEVVQLIGIKAPPMDLEEAKKEVMATGQDLETINKMGQETTEFVKKIMKGEVVALKEGEVKLVFDVQERDKYGRLLAYVYLPRRIIQVSGDMSLKDKFLYMSSKLRFKGTFEEIEGEQYWFLNAIIIEDGYATPLVPSSSTQPSALLRASGEQSRTTSEVEGMTIPPNVKYAELFKELYEEAREQKRVSGRYHSRSESINDFW